MPLYEHVVISRQDLSNAQAEGLVEHFGKVLSEKKIVLVMNKIDALDENTVNNKLSKLLKFSGNVQAKDINNNILKTIEAIYQKDKQLLKTLADTEITTSNKYQIFGSTIFFDNINKKIYSENPAKVLDIDGNTRYDALTDGLLMLRHMFGLTDDALITGTVATDAQYKTAFEIQERISLLGDLADVDGNGEIDALTDGLIVLRYLFGLRGESLIAGVVAGNATRTSHEAIEAHLASLTPVL
mgnify:CR=1 FL=1